MTIQIVGNVTRPNDVDLSLTITMPVEQWDRLLKVLHGVEQRNEHPFWVLRERIDKVLTTLRSRVCEAIEP